MSRAKLLVILVLITVMVLFFATGLNEALSLHNLQSGQAHFRAWFDHSPWLIAGAFFGGYLLFAVLMLPGATPLNLLAGALFGLGWGVPIVSFASALGAMLAFLLARTLLRSSVERRLARHIGIINRGIEREGGHYLFMLRLLPIFPFAVVNLAMGVTRLRPAVFYAATQLGLLPGIVVFVNAGQQISELQDFHDLLSPDLLGALALLATLQLTLYLLQRRRNRWRPADQSRHES
ncbi:putative membrane protein YdjX (TVP38/TMEM64 family) [Kushneria sinocarnis]|uniref:TVP38/TMEM64 family membrane protein n=1 Tax=Kushneria sinocarnis TaxID=595502 RepID=A0A420WZY4_9GAMM|nr:TVP38/TMEM64 family protein [Kushneria sinocarnis]RKR06913.1 putative membrane protein YdjX (TVP38/TMEM64 family) [Kushneria sinocarnis]